MKYKILLPAILLLLRLTLPSYAQTQTESPESSGNAYGIEPAKFYPGTLFLELMEAAEAEIEEAVYEAYAEGYKAAMTQYVPHLAIARMNEETLRLELEREQKKSCFFWPAIGISVSVSFAAGFLLHSLVSR